MKVQILSSSRLQADGQKTGEILVDYDDHPFGQPCCVMDIVLTECCSTLRLPFCWLLPLLKSSWQQVLQSQHNNYAHDKLRKLPKKSTIHWTKNNNSWCHADARQRSVNPLGKKRRSDNPGLKLSSNIQEARNMILFCLRSPCVHETQHSLFHTQTHTHTHVSFLHAKKRHTNHIQLGRLSITPVITFRPQHSITCCTLNAPQSFAHSIAPPNSSPPHERWRCDLPAFSLPFRVL